MGRLFTAAAPVCAQHGGPMRWVPAAGSYACRGYDGEGCGETVTPDQLDWVEAGDVAAITWERPWGRSVRD